MQRHLRLIVVLLFVLLLFGLFEWSGFRANFNLGFLHDTLRDNPLSGLLVFTAAFALGNLVQIPGWLFLAAAVLALGERWGGVATYFAACISCVVTFLIIRLLGGDALRQMDGKVAVKLLRGLDAHPVKSIVLLRMLFQTVPVLNYTLAMSGVKFRAYLLGTVLGLPLPIALYCVFFDYLAKGLKLV